MRVTVNRSSKRRRTGRGRAPARRRSLQMASSTRVDHVAGDAVVDHLGHRAVPKASTGVPQAIASIITSPNGSGQSIGNSSARASPRKRALARGRRSRRCTRCRAGRAAARSRCRKYSSSTRSTLAAILSGRPTARAICDRAVDALLRRDAAEERQVAAARIERGARGRSAGRDRRLPTKLASGIGARCAFGDRDERHLRKAAHRDAGDPAGPGGRAAS